MLNGDDIFIWQMSGRSDGKCAAERELLKKAKVLKYLKKELGVMYETASTELLKKRNDKDACEYIRGYQDGISTIMWFIYKGEHKNEN